jgi:hypothetical protein
VSLAESVLVGLVASTKQRAKSPGPPQGKSRLWKTKVRHPEKQSKSAPLKAKGAAPGAGRTGAEDESKGRLEAGATKSKSFIATLVVMTRYENGGGEHVLVYWPIMVVISPSSFQRK